MSDDKYFTKYLVLLNRLIESVDDNTINEYDFDMVEIFCEYISSNPEFKYNGTYLKDSLNDFRDKLTNFKRKKDLINKFCEKLQTNYTLENNWFVIIDNFYIIAPFKKVTLLKDYEDSLYIKKFITNFNLYKYDIENITIRYIKTSETKMAKDTTIEFEFVCTHKVKFADEFREFDICPMVEKKLKKLKPDEKGELYDEE